MVRSEQKEVRSLGGTRMSSLEDGVEEVVNYCKMLEEKLELMKAKGEGAADDANGKRGAGEKCECPSVVSRQQPDMRPARRNQHFKVAAEEDNKRSTDTEQLQRNPAPRDADKAATRPDHNMEPACKNQNSNAEGRMFKSSLLQHLMNKPNCDEEKYPSNLKKTRKNEYYGQGLEKECKIKDKDPNVRENCVEHNRKIRKLVYLGKGRDGFVCNLKRKHNRENYREVRKKIDALGFSNSKTRNGIKSLKRCETRVINAKHSVDSVKRGNMKTQDGMLDYSTTDNGNLDPVLPSDSIRRNDFPSSVTSEVWSRIETQIKQSEPQKKVFGDENNKNENNKSAHDNALNNHGDEEYTNKCSNDVAAGKEFENKSTETSSDKKEVVDNKTTISNATEKSRYAVASNAKCLRKKAVFNAQQLYHSQSKHKMKGKELVEIYRNPKYRESVSDFADGRYSRNYMFSSQMQRRPRGRVQVRAVDAQAPQVIRAQSITKMRADATFPAPRSKLIRPHAGTRMTIRTSIFPDVDFANIPFVAGTSTSPTHNIKLNVQLMLSAMKTRPELQCDLQRPVGCCRHHRRADRRPSDRRSPLSHWGSLGTRHSICPDDVSRSSSGTEVAPTTASWLEEDPRPPPSRPEDVWVADQDELQSDHHASSYGGTSGLVNYHQVLSQYVGCFEGLSSHRGGYEGRLLEERVASVRRTLESLEEECGRLKERYGRLRRARAGGAEQRALAAEVRRKEAAVEAAEALHRELTALRDRRRMQEAAVRAVAPVGTPAGGAVASWRRTQLLRAIQDFQFRLRQVV